MSIAAGSLIRRLIRRSLRKYNYGVCPIHPAYPITKPIKPRSVEILADSQFQQSVAETKELTLLDTARLANLWSLCQQTDPLGAILEVGTFKGGGALHLSNSAPDRKILICDPFSAESFKRLDPQLDRLFQTGQFSGVSPESVASLFRSRERSFEIIQGYFPESVKGRELPGISFVHLDVDVYDAIRESLEFLLNGRLLLRNSLIVIDDYCREAEGVNRAVEETVGGRPEWVALPMFPAQALLVPRTLFR